MSTRTKKYRQDQVRRAKRRILNSYCWGDRFTNPERIALELDGPAFLGKLASCHGVPWGYERSDKEKPDLTRERVRQDFDLRDEGLL
jgi:hypothetical protein